MQSCPKNVHTGPLTGDGKRSNMTAIVKESVPLPPVALALPLEPASVVGPPSPARGSAGMPPPPSPAGATYQPVNTSKWETKQETVDPPIEQKPTEKRRKARVGKTMARNNITSNFNVTPQQHTMLLMCHNPQPENEMSEVKREVESPEVNSLTEVSKDDRIPKLEENTKCEELEQEIVSDTVLKSELSDRLNGKDVCQKLEGEDHEDQCIPIDSTPTRRKSVETESNIHTLPNSPLENKVSIKRKLSIEETIEKEPEEGSVKKFKLLPTLKDSPKKSKITKTVKRKLIEKELTPTPKLTQDSKFKKTKRKIPIKDETQRKKLKSTNPLLTSNLHNSKQNKNLTKAGTIPQSARENREPIKKICQKILKTQVNSKVTKKIAPKINTSFVKNNVDKTIESVVLNSIVPNEIPEETNQKPIKTTPAENVIQEQPIESNVKLEQKVVKPEQKIIKQEQKVVKVEQKVVKSNCPKATMKKKKSKATTTATNNNNNNNMNNNNINNVVKTIEVPMRIPKRLSHTPKWSNGWSWEGNPFQGKVFLNVSSIIVIFLGQRFKSSCKSRFFFIPKIAQNNFKINSTFSIET